jgi:2-C-methyl-D-erythritol 4-phosphate cytidylyltransferase
VPKAFVPLAGRPMVEWSEAALRAAGLPFVRVVPEGYEGVRGGAVRSASVRAGLAALGPCDAVIVHDAARPLVPSALFGACLEALGAWDGAVAAARVTDTIRETADEGSRTLDRSRLWAVQTPQAFRRDVLERALDVPDDVLAAATDDASLVEEAGGRIGIVEAPAANFKVTTPHDLAVAEWLLSRGC